MDNKSDNENMNQSDLNLAIDVATKSLGSTPKNVTIAVGILLPQIEFGKRWTIGYIAESLDLAKEKPDSMKLQLAISSLTRALESHGYHIRRTNSGQFIQVDGIERAAGTVDKMGQRAADTLRRACTFATSTLRDHSDKLNDQQRKRLERKQHYNALTYLFAMRKSRKIS